MALTPGTRLGPYEIVAPLGAGGMGEVYRARDTRLNRDVALKTLSAAMATDSDRLARFEREAKTVAALSHPNIVMLHSIEEADGVRFLTMELVEGQGLDHLLAGAALPLSQVLDLAIPLTDAIAAAHEKDIVHRDLKPTNVMVTKDGRVKVLDFGLAKVRAEGPSDTDVTWEMPAHAPISAVGQVVGTVPYMAPEQLHGEAVDARTDIFSLGIVLYELVSGRRPFTGKSPSDISSSILRDAPPPLATLRPDLPRELSRIIGRCLEKEPRERFQTARDVYNELRIVRRELESGVSSSGTATQAPPSVPAAVEAPSIAVLPFVNLSRDEENEYFADGLSEELLNVLAKIRGLHVAARTSSFTFKGKGLKTDEIGRELNVATLLEGSVRKAGNRVRISVQLIKVADGYQLWSETYDRTLDDIFAVQDDIAQSVVKELRTTLLGERADSAASIDAKADVAAAVRGRAENPEAHRLYLQGLFFTDRRTPADTARGIECMKEALQLDPSYALAWAGLARAHTIDTGWGPGGYAEGYGRSREAARRALELEPDLAEGHAALAEVQIAHDWDWQGAEESVRRALELAPGQAYVLRVAAWLSMARGRVAEGSELLRRAVALDPLSTFSHRELGLYLSIDGRYGESEEMLRKAIELSPQSTVCRANLAYNYLLTDRLDEARVEAEQEPMEELRLVTLAMAHHRLGNAAESDTHLRTLIDRYAAGASYQIAEVVALRGDVDAAFDWLERSRVQRDPGTTYVMRDPFFRPLHGDPRWRQFLEKMGLSN